jgi:tetratricopeptide (TPR) repeat protein
MAEGNAREAVDALQSVVELYPRHPAKYAARLLLAQAYQEMGEPEKAAAELQANLDGDDLTPASPEWRSALFALGQLRYGQQQWDQAARLLEQAVARYPQDPLAATANYLLGECYLQHSGARADEKVAPLPVAERSRLEDVRNLKVKALAAFDQARTALERQAASGELTLLQESVLRNTCFARAALLKQLGRLDEALDAYTALINRYQHSPAVLDAYVQAAAIYLEQRQEAKARNAIAAAQSALKRMPDNGLVKDLTGESKADWERYLAWLAKL